MKKLSIALVTLVCVTLVCAACGKQNPIVGTYYYTFSEAEIENTRLSLEYIGKTPEERDKFIEDMQNECFVKIDNNGYTLQLITPYPSDPEERILTLKGTYTSDGSTISFSVDDNVFENYYNTHSKSGAFLGIAPEQVKESMSIVNKEYSISDDYKTLTNKQKENDIFKKR